MVCCAAFGLKRSEQGKRKEKKKERWFSLNAFCFKRKKQEKKNML
jgi:hypothetical protein